MSKAAISGLFAAIGGLVLFMGAGMAVLGTFVSGAGSSEPSYPNATPAPAANPFAAVGGLLTGFAVFIFFGSIFMWVAAGLHFKGKEETGFFCATFGVSCYTFAWTVIYFGTLSFGVCSIDGGLCAGLLIAGLVHLAGGVGAVVMSFLKQRKVYASIAGIAFAVGSIVCGINIVIILGGSAVGGAVAIIVGIIGLACGLAGMVGGVFQFLRGGAAGPEDTQMSAV